MDNSSNEQINLKVLEKKAYRSLFQDGLWDIYIGCIILGFMTISFYRIIPIYIGLIITYIWFGFAVILFTLGKKLISVPRMGKVKYGPKRKKNKKLLLIFCIINSIILLLLLIFLIVGWIQRLEINYIIFPIAIGVFLIWLPLTVTAILLDYRRLLLYAIFGGSDFVANYYVTVFFSLSIEILTYGLTGLFIILYGMILLRKFVINHPLDKYKVESDNN